MQAGPESGWSSGPNLSVLKMPASSCDSATLLPAMASFITITPNINLTLFYKMRITNLFCIFFTFLSLKFPNTAKVRSIINYHPCTITQLQ